MKTKSVVINETKLVHLQRKFKNGGRGGGGGGGVRVNPPGCATVHTLHYCQAEMSENRLR